MPHGDYTANQRDKLAEIYRKDRLEASKRTTLINQVVAQVSTEVIDIIPEGYPDFDSYEIHKMMEKEAHEKAFRKFWGIADSEEEVGEDDVTLVGEDTNDFGNNEFSPVAFQCTDTVEGATFGNNDSIFDLMAGAKYRAPKWVVEHLIEKDLVRL